MKKVFCIGEALIDFICKDVDTPLKEGENFIKKAGGAPANVAASIVKLGGEASFCGKVGGDAFGQFLVDEMTSHGIDCSQVVMDSALPTTLAFVSLKADGERDFEFFRGADGALRPDEISATVFEAFDIFHFGSATGLLDGIFMNAYTDLLKRAKVQGKLVSFDPNFRDLLWKDRQDEFVKRVKACLPYVDLLKMSEEEAHLIFNTEDKSDLAKAVRQAGVKCMTVTCGSEGTYVSVEGIIEELVPSIKIKSIDSTGAGDSFIGALLYQLSLDGNDLYPFDNKDNIRTMIEFSNKVGAITCTKLGAMESTPSLEEVETY